MARKVLVGRGQQVWCTYHSVCPQSFPWPLIFQEWAGQRVGFMLLKPSLFGISVLRRYHPCWRVLPPSMACEGCPTGRHSSKRRWDKTRRWNAGGHVDTSLWFIILFVYLNREKCDWGDMSPPLLTRIFKVSLTDCMWKVLGEIIKTPNFSQPRILFTHVAEKDNRFII